MAPRHELDWFRAYWRAVVGRLPRGLEPRFDGIGLRFPRDRVERAISTVGHSELRRTKDRWTLFLALFGEVP
jgi:hypothetical protein